MNRMNQQPYTIRFKRYPEDTLAPYQDAEAQLFYLEAENINQAWERAKTILAELNKWAILLDVISFDTIDEINPVELDKPHSSGIRVFSQLPDGTPLYLTGRGINTGQIGEWIAMDADGNYFQQSWFWSNDQPVPENWQAIKVAGR